MTERVRLSRWVFFVDYDGFTRVEHVLRGETWDADVSVANLLRHWTGFREVSPEHEAWMDRGVLVPYASEPLLPSGTSSEARMEAAWHEWYWQREAESEREYRWLGEIVLKMPSDLYFYQEIMTQRHVRRVLELGSGTGGGLWFFASVLSLLGGGGEVIGVEREPARRRPDFSRFASVRVREVEGDIHNSETLEQLAALEPFDLIVIDAPAPVREKVLMLHRYAELLAPGGTIVVEDLTQATDPKLQSELSRALDEFLLSHSAFRVDHHARRHLFLKGGVASFVRDPLGVAPPALVT